MATSIVDPVLDMWVKQIQQKIARLDLVFKTYVRSLAAQPLYRMSSNSIMDDDDTDPSDHLEQLTGIDSHLNQLLTIMEPHYIPPPTSQHQQSPLVQPAHAVTPATQNTLSTLLGTLKSVLPVKQMVAMWFQTEMITDLESIYYVSDFGKENAWLEHNKVNGPLSITTDIKDK